MSENSEVGPIIERVRIRPKPSGSIKVIGTVDIVDEEGNLLETKSNFSLCGCGLSNEKPFCDDSHKRERITGRELIT